MMVMESAMAEDEIKAAIERFEEELLYGYVGGRADDERVREEARERHRRSVLDDAIDLGLGQGGG